MGERCATTLPRGPTTLEVARRWLLYASPSAVASTPDFFALIDDEDAPVVLRYRWMARCQLRAGRLQCYAVAAVSIGNNRQRKVWLHRLLMSPPNGGFVDHKNGDGLDCRRENMRLATRHQNAGNRRKHDAESTSTPYKGVHRLKRTGRYQAVIRSHGDKLYLGTYGTAEEAARAYDAKAVDVFGPFALTNFPAEEDAG